MIASGYTLDLYCDREDKHPGGANLQGAWHAQFSDEERAQCFRAAAKAGWQVDRGARTCLCPFHASATNKGKPLLTSHDVER